MNISCHWHKKSLIVLFNNSNEYLQLIDNEVVVIYGAGRRGKAVLREIKLKFPNASILFCDQNYASLKEVEEVTVISPKEYFSIYSDKKVIIANVMHADQILMILRERGIADNNIYFENNELVD